MLWASYNNPIHIPHTETHPIIDLFVLWVNEKKWKTFHFIDAFMSHQLFSRSSMQSVGLSKTFFFVAEFIYFDFCSFATQLLLLTQLMWTIARWNLWIVKQMPKQIHGDFNNAWKDIVWTKQIESFNLNRFMILLTVG